MPLRSLDWHRVGVIVIGCVRDTNRNVASPRKTESQECYSRGRPSAFDGKENKQTITAKMDP